jgi:ribosomal protein S15P/S13E
LLSCLYKQIKKTSTTKPLELSWSMRVRKRCLQNECFDDKLNFTDLQILMLSFEIDNINRHLAELRQQKMSERGISSVEQISGTEALNYF